MKKLLLTTLLLSSVSFASALRIQEADIFTGNTYGAPVNIQSLGGAVIITPASSSPVVIGGDSQLQLSTSQAASEILVSDASRNVTSSGTSLSVLADLSGITANVQTQLNSIYNGYLSLSGGTLSGDLNVPSLNGISSSTLAFLSGVTGDIQSQLNSTAQVGCDVLAGSTANVALDFTHANASCFDAYVDTTAGQISDTLPTAVGKSGRCISVKNISNSPNALIITPVVGGQTIDTMSSVTLSVAQQSKTFCSDNANWQTK